MPRNGSGVYSLPSGYEATTGQTATASQHNSPLEDIKDDLNAARPIVAGGTGATTASAARTALGLEIGTDVQAYNANLASLSGLTFAANKGLYTTAANTAALFDLTSAGRALLDDADAAAQRTTLGLGNIATTDLIDEDDFASDTDAQAPTQQSVKAYTGAQFGTANAPGTKTALNASGSAPIYACRAWVNFNGTGTVAIRASGNVSSITDNATGDYTVNFTTAMPDVDYVVAGQASDSINNYGGATSFSTTLGVFGTPTTSAVRIGSVYTQSPSRRDAAHVHVAIFR